LKNFSAFFSFLNSSKLIKLNDSAAFDLKNNLVSVQYIGAGLVVVAVITLAAIYDSARPLTYRTRRTMTVLLPV
jgi:hypothetical protein